MSVPLLNASGCLDALAAPDVARSLDGFVTKTITPLPREGNPPVRIAETEHGMLNSIGLQGPGIDAFVESHLPRLAALDTELWVSVGGFSAADFATVCERLDGERDVAVVELNLSCPNVDEAPGDRGGARRGRPRRHEEAALREAFPCSVGHRRVGAGGRRGRGRRALARQHDPRARARRARCARGSPARPAATPARR